jgi:TRAP-type C4-dicarboxylate transport system permease large subunit
MSDTLIGVLYMEFVVAGILWLLALYIHYLHWVRDGLTLSPELSAADWARYMSRPAWFRLWSAVMMIMISAGIMIATCVTT